MRRRPLFVIFFLVAILLVVLGGGLAYASREPAWNPTHFTPQYQEKYATLEQAFELYVEALQAKDTVLYNEVLGYESSLSQDDFPLYSGPIPNIEELDVQGEWGHIWTDNRWEANFRRVNGRWCFWPEDFRMFLLQLINW